MLFTSPNLLGQPATSSVQSRHSYLHQPQSLPHQQSSSFLHQPPSLPRRPSVKVGSYLRQCQSLPRHHQSSRSLINTWWECHKSFSVTWRTIFLHVSSGSLFQPRHVSQREEPSRQRNQLLFLLFPLLVLLPIFLDPSAISWSIIASTKISAQNFNEILVESFLVVISEQIFVDFRSILLLLFFFFLFVC